MRGIVRLICALVTSAGLLYVTPVWAGSLGSLTQPTGGDGCVDYAGYAGCTPPESGYEALKAARAVAVSPNGQFVYAAAYEGDAIAAFSRDATTGALTPLPGASGCVKDAFYLANSCPSGVALGSPTDVAVSPDGANLYVTSQESDAVAVFAIAADGSIAQKPNPTGCWSSRAALYTAGTCQQSSPYLLDPTSITVAPDGEHLYVTGANGLEVFRRDLATGELTQPWTSGQCLTGLGVAPCNGAISIGMATDAAIGPDGQYLHIVSEDTDAVTNLLIEEDGTATVLSGESECVSDTVSSCTPSVTGTLDGPSGIAISPGGEHLYVTATNSSAVTVLSVAGDGSVSQLSADSCESASEVSGCDTFSYAGLAAPQRVAVSADGRSVYVVSPSTYALTAFERASDDGALTPLPEGESCLMDQNVVTSPCSAIRGLTEVSNLAISPDDDSVYAAGSGALGDADPMGGSIANLVRERSGDADSLGEVVDEAEEDGTAEEQAQDTDTTTTDTDTTTTDSTSSEATTTTATTSSSSGAITAESVTGSVACASLTVVRQRRAQSDWIHLTGGTHVRLRVPAGGYLLRSAARGSVRLDARSNPGRRSTVRRVRFYVDGRRVALDRRAPWSFVVHSSRYAVGHHTITAHVYPPTGRVKVVKLGLLIGRCEPARYTIYQSSLIRNAFANYRMSANAGSTELSSFSATVPAISRINRTGLRRSRGKQVGTLGLTRRSGRQLRYALKLPRRADSTLTLLSRKGGKVTLHLGQRRVTVSGLPAGITGLSIRLDNQKRRLFRNASVCGMLRYSATMISRAGDGLSFMRSRPQCTSRTR